MTDNTEPTPKPKTLVQKLCEVMAKVKYIQKLGHNQAQSYRYATEADVADALRGELAERNIFIFPNMVRNERVKLERMNYKGELKTSYATDLEMDWTFVDGDSGEKYTCRIPGCSESPGDKGVYVAMTGSEKYLLMKSFLIPTGDDPESDANEPQGTKGIADAKIAKLKEKASQIPAGEPAKAIPALFFTWPESHNSHFAEWVNVREFLATRQDIEDTLRMIFTSHKAKKTKAETVLVPSAEMQGLCEQLVGEMGLTVKELGAPANA
jgi:hypothetical protein